ncbi:MAG: hypothetical protein ACK53Y_02370 [bacterium]
MNNLQTLYDYQQTNWKEYSTRKTNQIEPSSSVKSLTSPLQQERSLRFAQLEQKQHR